MSTTTDMLRTYPKDLGSIDQAALAACVDTCSFSSATPAPAPVRTCICRSCPAGPPRSTPLPGSPPTPDAPYETDSAPFSQHSL